MGAEPRIAAVFRAIGFYRRNGMFNLRYGRLLWRYLWRRFLTPAGWRWETDGPVFFGRGLQLHPLSTFKKANLMHGACERGERTCDKAGLRRLLDEMEGLAVRRSRRFIAWEYAFSFGGGYPPWMSGMAQATGIQALARGAQLLNEPHYVDVARRGLGAFETPPPTGG